MHFLGMLFGILMVFLVVNLIAALWKGIAIILFMLVMLAIGGGLLVGTLMLVAAITHSAAAGAVAAAIMAVLECKWGYRIFYEH